MECSVGYLDTRDHYKNNKTIYSPMGHANIRNIYDSAPNYTTTMGDVVVESLYKEPKAIHDAHGKKLLSGHKPWPHTHNPYIEIPKYFTSNDGQVVTIQKHRSEVATQPMFTVSYLKTPFGVRKQVKKGTSYL